MMATTANPDFSLINSHSIARLRKAVSAQRKTKKSLPRHIAELLGIDDEAEEEKLGSEAWLRKFAQQAAATIAARHPSLIITLHVKIPKPRYIEQTAERIQARAIQGEKSKASITIPNADHGKPRAGGGAGVGAAFRSAWQWMIAPSPVPGQSAGWWAGNKRRDEYGL
jgi:hypothetical protein